MCIGFSCFLFTAACSFFHPSVFPLVGGSWREKNSAIGHGASGWPWRTLALLVSDRQADLAKVAGSAGIVWPATGSQGTCQREGSDLRGGRRAAGGVCAGAWLAKEEQRRSEGSAAAPGRTERQRSNRSYRRQRLCRSVAQVREKEKGRLLLTGRRAPHAQCSMHGTAPGSGHSRDRGG